MILHYMTKAFFIIFKRISSKLIKQLFWKVAVRLLLAYYLLLQQSQLLHNSPHNAPNYFSSNIK